MATVEKVSEVLSEQHLEAGTTHVRGLRVALGEDANGDEAIFVRLVLSDPSQDHETWPVDDLRALRRAVRDVLAELDPELRVPWVISFEPESGEELAPEDTADEVEIDT